MPAGLFGNVPCFVLASYLGIELCTAPITIDDD
jgi:hypothetical protein